MTSDPQAGIRDGQQDRTGANHPAPSIVPLGLLLAVNMVLVALLLPAAILRETREFWLNSGGYPLLLRTSVDWLFLPCMILSQLVAVGTLSKCWRLFQIKPAEGLVFLAPCLLQLVALSITVVIVI